ncbi:unnamed protein product [Blepharisma stoltei]|uniref:Autophagy-related protein n=1 Tax=Blepharisma stoltei TaxID=1481888 RepID=A0AAU9JUN2_9CILI|nr:unnamed protein product [Blepharisma stoltei]
MAFKEELPQFEARRLEANHLLETHPTKLPVIVEPILSKKNSYGAIQNRFLVPQSYTFHEFIFHLRRRLELDRTDALYVLISKKHLPVLDRNMISIYEEFQDPDGFLYVNYSSEAILG